VACVLRVGKWSIEQSSSCTSHSAMSARLGAATTDVIYFGRDTGSRSACV